MSIRLRAVSEFHCSYGYNATHSGSHRFIPRMNIEVSGSCHIGVAQQARYRCDVDAVFDSACRKRVSHGVKFDMFQVQLPQNPRKVMAEVVRVHHTAATIKNDKIRKVTKGCTSKYNKLSKNTKYIRINVKCIRPLITRRSQVHTVLSPQPPRPGLKRPGLFLCQNTAKKRMLSYNLTIIRILFFLVVAKKTGGAPVFSGGLPVFFASWTLPGPRSFPLGPQAVCPFLVPGKADYADCKRPARR